VKRDAPVSSRFGRFDSFQSAWKDRKTAEYAIGAMTFDPAVGRFQVPTPSPVQGSI
jgi:hypothetical protein